MPDPSGSPAPVSPRIASIDALRGFVMFSMIFVNDLAGVSDRVVPWWMKHYHGKSGMTFVDLVFPAFIFIVGMSIPVSIEARLRRGDSLARVFRHIVARTAVLLIIGILMVNAETPDPGAMSIPVPVWMTLVFACAILSVIAIAPRAAADDEWKLRQWRMLSVALRTAGFLGLVVLAAIFRGGNGKRVVTWEPFAINTEWYGILGLIGWAYLMACVVYLIFRGNRLAQLACTALLLSFYPADRAGAFQNFWPARFVGFGETLGSQASIAVAGMLLSTFLFSPEGGTIRARVRFTLLFAAGFAATALLLHGLYGINKNNATPSWCLWACAITSLLWLCFYFICEVRRVEWIARPLVLAGTNVLLAYLISEMVPSLLEVTHLAAGYARFGEINLACAIARSAGCGVVVLLLATLLNRAGVRARL